MARHTGSAVVRSALCALAAGALAFGAAGCTAPDAGPTGIPTPSASSPSAWGAYENREQACSAVAGDVLTLALVPKNLALADPQSGVSDIDDVIVAAATAAPAAILPNYQQLSAIVRAFGTELSQWSAALDDARASASATPAASSASSPSPSATPTGPAAEPERPTFDTGTFTLQLDTIKGWLSATCA